MGAAVQNLLSSPCSAPLRVMLFSWNLTGQPLAVRLATRRISATPVSESARQPSSSFQRPAGKTNEDHLEKALSRSASSSATDDDLSVPPAETEVDEDEDYADSARSRSSFSYEDGNAGTSSSSASSESVEHETETDLRERSDSSFSSSSASSFSASSCPNNNRGTREKNFRWSKLNRRRLRGSSLRRTSREGREGSQDREGGFLQNEGDAPKEREVTLTRKQALTKPDVFPRMAEAEGQLEDEYVYEWRTLPPEESLPLPQDEEVRLCKCGWTSSLSSTSGSRKEQCSYSGLFHSHLETVLASQH